MFSNFEHQSKLGTEIFGKTDDGYAILLNA